MFGDVGTEQAAATHLTRTSYGDCAPPLPEGHARIGRRHDTTHADHGHRKND